MKKTARERNFEFQAPFKKDCAANRAGGKKLSQ